MNFYIPADYFRQQYYETFDVLIQEIDNRFCQESLDVLQEMEDIVVGSCNGTKVILPKRMKKIYGQELDFQRLESQSLMVPDLVKTENQKSRQFIPIKYVSSISTVCEIFISNPFTKLMLSEINKMLFLHLTASMTSFTAVRSVSSLRRLKTSKIYNDTEEIGSGSYITTLTLRNGLCLGDVGCVHVYQLPILVILEAYF